MSDSPQPTCPICSHSHPRLSYRIPTYSVLRCRACQQCFLWPLPTPEEIQALFNEFYSTGKGGSLPELDGYYQYCFDDSPTNPLVRAYQRWLDAIEALRAPGRLLDVGCGAGLFLSLAQRRGWKVVGIDESPEGARLARERFGLDVRLGSFDAIDEVDAELGSFDAITGWDIIEHSRRPVALLRAMRRHLAPGGVVGLSTPNRRSLLNGIAGAIYHASFGRFTGPLEKLYFDQHFLYFAPRTLSAALERAGLEAIRIQLESTDLERLSLSPAMRLALRTIFAVARRIRLENRLFALARAVE